MIRVFYITHSRLSFMRAHTRNILKTSEALNMVSGISVQIVSSGKEQKSFDEIQKIHGVRAPLEYAFAPRIIWYVLRNRTWFDVLYFRDPKLFGVAFFARFFLGKKVVFEIHGNKESKLLIPLWVACFWISHGAIFITDRLRTWYRPRTKPWITVHANAPDFTVVPESAEQKLGRKKQLGLPEHKSVLLYVGSGFWYRLDVLIAMMRFLPDACFLVLAGLKENEIQNLSLYAEEKKVTNRVRFLSRIEPRAVPQYLLAADILLNSYTDYLFDGGVSSKLYEYLATGVPIISHCAGANDEILRHEENALIVNSGDPRDYAAAVERILDDPVLREKLGTQARRDSAMYTWEKRAERITLLLKKIIA